VPLCLVQVHRRGYERDGSETDLTLEQSKFQYSYFDKTKMTDVLFDHVDFSESSMTQAKLKRFEANDSRFVKNNFFQTMLSDVDFTNNTFAAPAVSVPPVELKGAVINVFQAADLVRQWGILVNP